MTFRLCLRTDGICDIGGAFGAAHDEGFSAVGDVAASLFVVPFAPQS